LYLIGRHKPIELLKESDAPGGVRKRARLRWRWRWRLRSGRLRYRTARTRTAAAACGEQQYENGRKRAFHRDADASGFAADPLWDIRPHLLGRNEAGKGERCAARTRPLWRSC
jgi:hypothetical protein